MPFSRKASFASLAALLFATLLAAPEARADQVAITSGHYWVSATSLVPEPRFRSMSFNLQGANFRTAGSVADGPNRQIGSDCQFPCKAGSTFSLSPKEANLFTETPTSILTINGQNHFGWFDGGALQFQTDSVTIPLDAGPELTLTARFTMSGTVSFAEYDLDKGIFTGLKYEAELFGSGAVNIFLFYNRSNDGYSVRAVQYNFTAVPEPATMLLLGTGLAGVAARRRAKRRKERDAAAASC